MWARQKNSKSQYINCNIFAVTEVILILKKIYISIGDTAGALIYKIDTIRNKHRLTIRDYKNYNALKNMIRIA